MKFNWNVQNMRQGIEDSDSGEENLLIFALPHHQDIIEESKQEAKMFATLHTDEANGVAAQARICKGSLLGATCLMKGGIWSLETSAKAASFRAPRPPKSDALSALATAFKRDLKYELPSYFQKMILYQFVLNFFVAFFSI